MRWPAPRGFVRGCRIFRMDNTLAGKVASVAGASRVRWSVLAMLQVASMLLAEGASAEGSACEQLKGRLAARIDPGIRGYTLEAVPAAAPPPPGAKRIGPSASVACNI